MQHQQVLTASMWQPSLSVQASGGSVSKGALLGLSTQHTKADWYRGFS